MGDMKDKSVSAQEAKHGEKMIEIKVRFWTNHLADAGQIRPKHAWDSGVIRIGGNRAHGVVAGKPKTFNTLFEIGPVMEAVLIENGITLHHDRRTRKYVSEEPYKKRTSKQKI